MSDQSTSMPHRDVEEDAAAPAAALASKPAAIGKTTGLSGGLAEHLRGMQFPISKADLVQNIRWQKAPLLIYFVEKLPDRHYHSADEITAKWSCFDRHQWSSDGNCRPRLCRSASTMRSAALPSP